MGGRFFNSSANFLFPFSAIILSTIAASVGNAKASISQMFCAVFSVKNLKVNNKQKYNCQNVVLHWYFLSF